MGVGTGLAGGTFASADELREVLDRLLASIDSDPEAGPAMRSTGVPCRFVFPDVDTTLSVTGSEDPGRCLAWSFDSLETPAETTVSLEMDSDVANRFLQGRENLAIGMARGRIRVACPKARAALAFLPRSRAMITHYREVVASGYEHLVVN